MNQFGTILQKVKGLTTAVQTFVSGTALTFSATKAKPMRGFWLHFMGRSTITSGGDPAYSLDTLLKLMGTIEVTIQNDDGDYNLVPQGTEIRRLFHNIRAIHDISDDRGRGMFKPMNAHIIDKYPVVSYYKGVSGLFANNPEDFLVSLYFPFQFIGGDSTERDICAWNPTAKDRQLNVIVTPPAVTVASVDPGQPYPGAGNTYVLSGIQGRAGDTAKIVFEADFMTPVPKSQADGGSSLVGTYLPIWQEQTTQQTYAASNTVELQLQNWQRGGNWHAMCFNEWGYDPSGGGEVFLGTPAYSMLGPIQLLADADPIHQIDMMGKIAAFNPYSAARANTTGIRNMEPIVVDMNSGGSFFSLPDFSQYVSAQKQINLQFDTLYNSVIDQSTFKKQNLSVMTLRYVKRNR